jgi:hypothetical protein
MARKRFGVVPRATVERRTFREVVYDSRLECSRAWQHAAIEQGGHLWTPHPKFALGCPENTYTADFRAWEPDDPRLYVRSPSKGWPALGIMIPVPDGWVEEVKGPVKAGVDRLKKLWRQYGPVTLVILSAVGRDHGLKQQWAREIIVPIKGDGGGT